jgi:hypothetical protein
MDAASHRALSLALKFDLPTALADALLENERTRMRLEDQAAHGISGRVSANGAYQPHVHRLTWAHNFNHLSELHLEVEQTLQMTQEKVRRALSLLRVAATTQLPIETALEFVAVELRQALAADAQEEYSEGGSDGNSDGSDGLFVHDVPGAAPPRRDLDTLLGRPLQ